MLLMVYPENFNFYHAMPSSGPHKPLSLFWCWKMFVGPQMGKSSETDAGHPCLVYAAKCIFTPLAQKSKDQNQSLTKKVTSSFFQYNHLQLTYAVTMKLAMYSSVWGPLLVDPRCRTSMEPRWHPIARCPSHHDPASKDVPQSGHQGKPWSDVGIHCFFRHLWGLRKNSNPWSCRRKHPDDFIHRNSLPDLKHGKHWNLELFQKQITQSSGHINTWIPTFILNVLNSNLPPTVPLCSCSFGCFVQDLKLRIVGSGVFHHTSYETDGFLHGHSTGHHLWIR